MRRIVPMRMMETICLMKKPAMNVTLLHTEYGLLFPIKNHALPISSIAWRLDKNQSSYGSSHWRQSGDCADVERQSVSFHLLTRIYVHNAIFIPMCEPKSREETAVSAMRTTGDGFGSSAIMRHIFTAIVA
jgi:hypothetical protein